MVKIYLLIVLLAVTALLINLSKYPSVLDNIKNIRQEGGLDLVDNLSPSNPVSINALKESVFDGSEITVEKELPGQTNYRQYLVYYYSEGLKNYALLTMPTSPKPESGYPVIVFNHGYINPVEYVTTQKYVSYVDYFARNGYIVMKPDYRGHGNSQGEATGGYGSNSYTIDVINAVRSVKKYEGVNPERIGMWGHSMGGFITLRSMVVIKDIKAGVIWGGVVAPYSDLLANWRKSTPPPEIAMRAKRWRQVLIETFGSPEANPGFWNSISANSYLNDLSGPIQLHHAKDDASVPYTFSENLFKDLEKLGNGSELYLYDGDNHNIANNFSIAMRRSLAFFDKYLK